MPMHCQFQTQQIKAIVAKLYFRFHVFSVIDGMVDMQEHRFDALFAVDVHGHKSDHAEVIDLQESTVFSAHTATIHVSKH